MASSGKKNKKNKGTVVSLQSFLSNGVGVPVGTTQVAKKVRNLEADDSDDSSSATTQVYQLPTAPRASRVLDDDSVPSKPPFLAFVTNLPFDIQESDFHEIFCGVIIASIRLPREDGEGGRIRGFGYVEFESREDLIYALSMPDPQIKGRRVRIDISNGNEPSINRSKNNRRAYDGFGNTCETRNSTNWRENSKSSIASVIAFKTSDRSLNQDAYQKSDEAGISWRSGNCSAYQSQVANRTEQWNYDKYHDNARQKIHESDAQDRPKLNLKPRSLPLPCSFKSSEVKKNEKFEEISDNHKVFGSSTDMKSRTLEMEGRIIEVKRVEKFQSNLEQKNGNRSEVEYKHFHQPSQNYKMDNWRFMERSADSKSASKVKPSLSSESESQNCEGSLHVNSNNKITSK